MIYQLPRSVEIACIPIYTIYCVTEYDENENHVIT